jgi:hypothetical protein
MVASTRSIRLWRSSSGLARPAATSRMAMPAGVGPAGRAARRSLRVCGALLPGSRYPRLALKAIIPGRAHRGVERPCGPSRVRRAGSRGCHELARTEAWIAIPAVDALGRLCSAPTRVRGHEGGRRVKYAGPCADAADAAYWVVSWWGCILSRIVAHIARCSLHTSVFSRGRKTRSLTGDCPLVTGGRKRISS